MSSQNNTKSNKNPRIRLPFESRKMDIGEWAYAHRAGLCVTIIVYLVAAIVFVSAKIAVGGKPHQQGMYIDLQELVELESLRDKLQKEVAQKQQFDWSSVKNATSNENAESQSLKDNIGSRTSDIDNSAAEAKRQMEANRKEYEKGLAEAEALRTRKGNEGQEQIAQDSKVQGNVTVSFSLNNPLRHARHLVVPAYRCQGGGEVKVSITVDNSGKVIAAKVIRGGDDCMRETALGAAKASTFDTNASAPARHVGEITYIFIPQ